MEKVKDNLLSKAGASLEVYLKERRPTATCRAGGPLSGMPIRPGQRPGQDGCWTWSLCIMSSGVQAAEGPRFIHHRGEKEGKVSVMLLDASLGDNLEDSWIKAERKTTECLFSKLKGEETLSWNTKQSYGKQMLLCITDASCEDSHLLFFFSLFNRTPTSLWFHFIL